MKAIKVEPVKGNIIGEKYVKEMLLLIGAIEKDFQRISKTVLGNLTNKTERVGQLDKKTDECCELIHKSVALSNDFSVALSQMYRLSSDNIMSIVIYASVFLIASLLISTTLLLIFTIYIKKTISNPVKSIITQLEAFGKGKADLSKEIEIVSEDEIGLLSAELNEFIKTIHEKATFKKVIEEDTSLMDVLLEAR